LVGESKDVHQVEEGGEVVTCNDGPSAKIDMGTTMMNKRGRCKGVSEGEMLIR
jgi:hypothetical protein